MRVSGDCKHHGYYKGTCCPLCQLQEGQRRARKYTTALQTQSWVRGEYEHIDPFQPRLKIDSKEQLIAECEKRGLYAKAFMKPKSQGKGFEHKKRAI